ncbi:putative TPR repeat methyltransferase [Rhizobium sp. PP-F2F-G48]|uniref:methyltransferase domain-containing protein n=1 Tax=Rhizobium sp. PP-F2F-G48 TaxID=2135651 RepID=UPI0010498A33|nr:methyltransferase domain-containing protein [Rhizobium sp. PP-F2F-G48]TCM56110.1 putative TPR repeat methyltransferase [Rhizobium sp. PP-F2F-G48]
MNAHQLSSGDLLADRRAEYAQMLAASGDHAEAADLMRQALERVPDWAAGWFRLAEHEEKAGEREAAAASLARVLDLNPDDMFGARLKRAVLGADTVPGQAPSAYVARLFDDYADRFDAALVERLDYTVPGRLAAMVERFTGGATLERAIDLGCGTGLFGAEIRHRVGMLEGYDLSSNMLAKAAEKHLYDHLGDADLSRPLDTSGLVTPDFPEGRADLAVAADVLMYLGDLLAVFAIVPALLKADGLFAFSVEDAEAPVPEVVPGGASEGFVLRPSLRYAHSEGYIRKLCRTAGLEVIDMARAVIRKDGAQDVVGILFLSRKGL